MKTNKHIAITLERETRLYAEFWLIARDDEQNRITHDYRIPPTVVDRISAYINRPTDNPV